MQDQRQSDIHTSKFIPSVMHISADNCNPVLAGILIALRVQLKQDTCAV